MSKTILNDQGEEEIVFSDEEKNAEIEAEKAKVIAEYEAKLAEKEAHVKEKLDQFQQAKKGVEMKDEETRKLAEEAKRIAEEAQLSIRASKESELNTRKDYWISTVAGNDAELIKKITESYDMLNLPNTNDKEIAERVQKAVTLAGITQPASYNFSMNGMSAPNFQKVVSEQNADASYENFKKELGIKL